MTTLVLDTTAIASAVERAVAGDEVAFARIVGSYHLDLVRVAYAVCGDEGLAEDAAQSAWWIAWRKLPALRDPDRLRSWLVAIAANEARKSLQRERRHRVREIRMAAEGVAAPGHGASSDVDHEIDEIDLADALARLKPEDRALVALRYAADIDASELAPCVGLSPSGVRTRLSRSLERLRRDLGDD